MFDPVLIEGIHPAILALLPFVIVAITLAVREGFKAAGKEVPSIATQVIAFVVSAACIVGTFLLSGKVLPVDFEGWSSLLVSVFGAQMLAYEIVIKRVLAALEK